MHLFIKIKKIKTNHNKIQDKSCPGQTIVNSILTLIHPGCSWVAAGGWQLRVDGPYGRPCGQRDGKLMTVALDNTSLNIHLRVAPFPYPEG
jgi:hypothetical protein